MVFVWCEDYTDIKRWRDGRSWTGSRVDGSFQKHKELDEDNSFGPDGLVKRTLSITTSDGKVWRLVNYLPRSHEGLSSLTEPGNDLKFQYIRPSEDLYGNNSD